MAKVIGRSGIPVILAAIFSLVMIINFFMNIPPITAFADEAMRMFVPLVSMAGIVGSVNLLLFHTNRISKKAETWPMSIVLIVSFFIYLFAALMPGLEEVTALFYLTIVGRTKEATWAIIALFMASMAYRAFRIKNTETFLFTLGCVIVLLGNAPIGDVILPGAYNILRWVMDVPTMAAMRAVGIGTGLAIIAYGVRMILGYDRTALGEFGSEE